MRNWPHRILLFALCCAPLSADEGKEAKWKLAKNKKGVKVYTRKVEGISFKEYKGVTTIKTSLARLVALAADIEAGPDWIDTCSKGELLKQVNPRESYTYSLNGAPWPVRDRDAVVHNVISQDAKTLAVTIKMTGTIHRNLLMI